MLRTLLYRSLLTGLLLPTLFLAARSADEHDRVRCGFLIGDERVRTTKLGEGIQAERPRPVLPEFVDSENGHFRVHFSRTGNDAVPTDDLNGNGTPDFVEEAITSLVASWERQRNFGAPLQPPSDGVAGGSPALDVYLRDLATEGSAGTGFYGITIPDSLIGSGGDPWPRFTSWMEVDNDFSPADTNIHGDTVFATFGVDGLRVTCAHELHHVAQLAEVGDPKVQLMLYEMMSTFMEIHCYPELSDWAVYAAKFFRTPAGYALGDPGSLNGYVWGWFFGSWQQRAPNLVAGIFSAMQDGERPFTAFVSASTELGSSGRLDSVFVRALPDMYHTGSRGSNNAVILRADSLPEIAWHVDEPALPPSTMATGTLRPFEVRAFRYAIPALSGNEPVTTSILLTWPDMEAYQSTEFAPTRSFTVILTQDPAGTDIPIAGTRWGVRIQPESIAAWIDNIATRRPQAPYPQPVVLTSSTYLFVPIADALPGDEATISLMTVQTLGISTTTTNVVLDGDRIVVPFQLPADLTPGTYLLRSECNGRSELHKLAVRR